MHPQPITHARTIARGAVLTAALLAGCSAEPTGTTEALAVPSISAAAAVRTGVFPITDLGTLPGGSFSSATDINASGVVVGFSDYNPVGDPHAFRWTQGGGMVDLGTLMPFPGSSTANAINDKGEIVGWSDGLHGGVVSTRAFYWSSATGMVELPSDTISQASAWDIGPGSVIVGCGTLRGGTVSQVLRWTKNGAGTWTATGLGQPVGAPGNSCQSGLGGGGIAGTNVVGTSYPNGFLYSGGVMKALPVGTSATRILGTRFVGSLGGTASSIGNPSEWPSLTALPFSLGYLYQPGGESADLSSANHLVGYVTGPVGGASNRRAFYWDCANGMTDLGSLGGSVSDPAGANAINASDVVAGFSNNHAVIWGVIPQAISVYQLPFVRNCSVPPNVRYLPKQFINDGFISRPGFDATKIDPNSVTISDGFGHVTPIAHRTRPPGPPVFQLRDINGDGVLDMQVQFSTTEMIANGTLTPQSFQFVVSWVDVTGLPGSGKYPIKVQ